MAEATTQIPAQTRGKLFNYIKFDKWPLLVIIISRQQI